MPALVSARFLVPACLVLTVSRYRETEPAPLRPTARCRREPLRSATNLAVGLPAPGKAQAPATWTRTPWRRTARSRARTNPKLWSTRVTLPPT